MTRECRQHLVPIHYVHNKEVLVTKLNMDKSIGGENNEVKICLLLKSSLNNETATLFKKIIVIEPYFRTEWYVHSYNLL